MTTLVLIAKECIPGKVKTRLHPPFTLDEAAAIARASLLDTIAATANLPASRRILYFDGALVPHEAAGWEVIPQVHGTLDERIAAVFDLCDGPTLLLGMDTPQVNGGMLAQVFERWPRGVDAWIGPAIDGGFWALALANPKGELVRGVPMSRRDTGSIQRQRLRCAGLRVRELPALVDIDTVDDLVTVADALPDSLLARTVRDIRVAQEAQ
jgi:glycosyltransferase A (GT-A) superfamily protein (DUF2064 family)